MSAIIALSILLVCVGAITLTWSRSRHFCNPLNLILCWWGGWLGLACSRPFGLLEIKSPTLLIFGAFFCTLALTAALVVVRTQSRKARPLPAEGLLSRMSVLFSVLFTPVVLYYACVSYLFFQSYSGSANIRAALILYEHDAIFGSSFGRNAFSLFVGTTIYLIGIAACIRFVVYGRWKTLVLTFVLTAIYGSIEGGRGAIYRLLLLLFVVASFHLSWKELILFIRRRAVFATVVALAGVVFLVFSTLRRAEGQMSIEDILAQVVRYHTAGPVLFQDAYEDPESILSEGPQYGRCSASGVEMVALMGVRRIIPGFSTLYCDSLFNYVYEFKPVAVMGSTTFKSNSFYTSLFLLYADFRWFGITIIPALSFCAIEVLRRKWLAHRSVFALWMGINLTLFWLFSIFQSPLQTPWFVAGTFAIFIFGPLENLLAKRARPVRQAKPVPNPYSPLDLKDSEVGDRA